MKTYIVAAVLLLLACKTSELGMSTETPHIPTSTVIVSTPTQIVLHVTVTGNLVNVRPSPSEQPVGQVTQGTQLDVVPSYNVGWYEIVEGEYKGDVVWSGCIGLDNAKCEAK